MGSLQSSVPWLWRLPPWALGPFSWWRLSETGAAGERCGLGRSGEARGEVGRSNSRGEGLRHWKAWRDR